MKNIMSWMVGMYIKHIFIAYDVRWQKRKKYGDKISEFGKEDFRTKGLSVQMSLCAVRIRSKIIKNKYIDHQSQVSVKFQNIEDRN